MPCLKSIVLIEVPPLTTRTHFPFPDNIFSSCLSLLKACLLSVKLSFIILSLRNLSHLLTQSLNAINHHPRHFYQINLQRLLTSHYHLVWKSSKAYGSKNQRGIWALHLSHLASQPHFTFLALFFPTPLHQLYKSSQTSLLTAPQTNPVSLPCPLQASALITPTPPFLPNITAIPFWSLHHPKSRWSSPLCISQALCISYLTLPHMIFSLP